MKLQHSFFGKKMPIKYKFNLVDISSYHIEFEIHIKSKLMKEIFDKAMALMIRKKRIKGVKAEDFDIDKIQSFQVPENLLPKLHTGMLKSIRQVEKEVKNDGIELMNSSATSANYYKRENEWLIKINIGGLYADKR